MESFQRSGVLAELVEEERMRGEWRIGQHPLLGLDELMDNMLELPISLNEEEIYAQTSDSPHGILISEADEVDKSKSHLRKSDVQNCVSNWSGSEQVYAQDQPRATNRRIPRSIDQWRRKEFGPNPFNNSNILSSSEAPLLILPHVTTVVKGQGRQRSIGFGSSTAFFQRPLGIRRKLCSVKIIPRLGYVPQRKTPCACRRSNFQLIEANKRCAKLKAMGLSDAEIFKRLIEENWHGHRSDGTEMIKIIEQHQNHPGKKLKNALP